MSSLSTSHVAESPSGIRYRVCAPEHATDSATAETLIFLHGIGGDHDSFAPQLHMLSDHHRCIAWNMPGYGGSTALADVSFASLAQSLNQFIEEMELDAVHLIGQSIGGMLAQEMFVRYPDKIKSLTLIATTSAFGGRDDSFKDAFVAARLKPLDEGATLEQLAKRFVPEIVGNKVSDVALNSAIGSMSRVPEQTYRDIIRCLVTFDRRNEAGEITVPVCLVAGELDSNAPARTMQRLAERIHDAEYHLIDGGGHLVNLEQPDVFNDILRSFLVRLQQA